MNVISSIDSTNQFRTCDSKLVAYLTYKGFPIVKRENFEGTIFFYFDEKVKPESDSFYNGAVSVFLPKYCGELKEIGKVVYNMRNSV